MNDEMIGAPRPEPDAAWVAFIEKKAAEMAKREPFEVDVCPGNANIPRQLPQTPVDSRTAGTKRRGGERE